MSDTDQQITPHEALDYLRDWERQVAPGSERQRWYRQIIACVEGMLPDQQTTPDDDGRAAPRLSDDVLLPLPDFVQPCGEGFLEEDGQEGRYIRVDADIVPAVQALWAAGIATRASCDGHGGDVGYVLVEIKEGAPTSPFTIFTWAELGHLHDECEDTINALRDELNRVRDQKALSDEDAYNAWKVAEELRAALAAATARAEAAERERDAFRQVASSHLVARKQAEADLVTSRRFSAAWKEWARRNRSNARQMAECWNRACDDIGILNDALAQERAVHDALLETGPDEPLMTDPSRSNAYTFWFCGGTIRRGHADNCPWQRFVALAQQHAPATAGGSGE
jgi:hypothetical protein